jgi:Zn-dependent protease
VHLLIGILYEEQTLAHQVLENAGLSLYDVRSYVLHHAASFKSRFSPHEHTRLRPSPTFFILVLVMLTSGAALYLNVGAELVTPLTLLFIVSGWVVSLCLHEFGHALAAYYGGDRAVREAGYLTLNPVKYTQVVFSIVLPLLILFLGGLGLPGGAVYVNHQALRSPGWRSFVAAAGPLGTIAFGILIILPFVFGLAPDGFMFEFGLTTQSSAFWSALAFLGFLQITALVFNLIPIPPLDGFGILEPFLPGDIADQLRKYSGLLFLLLLLILWMGGPITDAFWRETFRLADMVGIPIDLVFNGMQQFLFWR